MSAELASYHPDVEPTNELPLAGKSVVITGTSRGIGARAAVEYARAGANVIGTHSNPHPKRVDMQEAVMEECRQVNPNGRFESVLGDITNPQDRLRLLQASIGEPQDATGQIDVVILNAAGGLEKDKGENYAERINFEANMALVEEFFPYMSQGSVIIFTQSMWGHLYGEVNQEPEYEPVARSKHMAETELRRKIPELEKRGIRVGIIVGDVISNTAMYNIVKRRDGARLSREEMLVPGGVYPTPDDMARRMVSMTVLSLPSGHTEYVGRTRDQYLEQFRKGEISRSTV